MHPATDQVLDLIMFMMFVYIPIFTVLFTHFMNYSSVRSILKMLWDDKNFDRSESDDINAPPNLLYSH